MDKQTIEKIAEEIVETFDFDRFDKKDLKEWVIQIYIGAFVEGLEFGLSLFEEENE